MRVLVLHGMFCTAWHTGRLVEGLRGAGLDAVGLELPGRGSGRGTLNDHVHWLCRLARAESEGGLALLGHSMGALLCLLAAARLADEPWLRKLALLGSAPPDGVAGLTWANLPVFLPAVLGGGVALPPPARYASLFMNRQDATLRARVHARLVPESRSLIRSVALPLLDRTRAARPRFATVPRFQSLVLAGAGDRSTPPRVQRALARLLPAARVECLEGPDHYGFIEGVGSEETLGRLVRFLGD